MNNLAIIVAKYKFNFVVELNNQLYIGFSKNKQSNYVVGDKVHVEIINSTQVRIIDYIKRKNLITRTDHNKQKLIASNIDLLLIVIAINPAYNSKLLNSCLLYAACLNIKPIIIINKCDLSDNNKLKEHIENIYSKIGYTIINMSAYLNCNQLNNLIQNQSSLLIGQSGVGKSTILNCLVPNANQTTHTISKFLNMGVHTTTSAHLFHINQYTQIIDCPGLQNFGLFNLDIKNLLYLMPECIDLIGKCKFNNCLHLQEPECAIINAYKTNKIAKERFNFLQEITRSLEKKPKY